MIDSVDDRDVVLISFRVVPESFLRGPIAGISGAGSNLIGNRLTFRESKPGVGVRYPTFSATPKVFVGLIGLLSSPNTESRLH